MYQRFFWYVRLVTSDRKRPDECKACDRSMPIFEEIAEVAGKLREIRSEKC